MARAILLVLAVSTAAGLAILWPDDQAPAATTSTPTDRAVVTTVSARGCEEVVGAGCVRASIELETGDRAGRSSFVLFRDHQLADEVDAGDHIQVQRNPEGTFVFPEGRERTGDPVRTPYAFVDFERKPVLLWLGLALCLLVVTLARWRGLLSLVGLGAGLLVLTQFVVPAIVHGSSPFAVALVGAMAIMFATMPLAHGLGPKSTAAMLGTAVTLGLTALLAGFAVDLAHVTGLSSSEAQLLGGTTGRLSFSGLILAGMVIGALGVLDDVTISQASTVMALRRADPAQGARTLYRRALSVGRDHISATVNTLVLAYAGSALPLLVVFSTQGTTFDAAINQEGVATEVIAILVGSIGLVGAVPLTTGLAALLAARIPAHDLPDEQGAHVH